MPNQRTSLCANSQPGDGCARGNAPVEYLLCSLPPIWTRSVFTRVCARSTFRGKPHAPSASRNCPSVGTTRGDFARCKFCPREQESQRERKRSSCHCTFSEKQIKHVASASFDCVIITRSSVCETNCCRLLARLHFAASSSHVFSGKKKKKKRNRFSTSKIYKYSCKRRA